VVTLVTVATATVAPTTRPPEREPSNSQANRETQHVRHPFEAQDDDRLLRTMPAGHEETLRAAASERSE
jgi:hypothetical protein